MAYIDLIQKFLSPSSELEALALQMTHFVASGKYFHLSALVFPCLKCTITSI